MAGQAPFSSPTASTDHDDLADQFPASFRQDEDVVAPTDIPSLAYLAAELNPSRLHGMTHLLWLAGRPVPPRPLHHQLLLGREIVLSERIDMHMLWGQGRIFVKPLPRYLVNPRFWTDVLVCACVPIDPGSADIICLCGRQRLRDCAMGLLVHYAALVAYESDFAIAVERHLIPFDVSWPRWRRFVREILHRNGDGDARPGQVYAGVAERFIYGELRLNRLNLIQLIRRGPFSKHFLAMWNSYGSFYRDNWAFIVGVTAWILLILSAMQVGLGTTRLGGDDAFQAASYGFTVFSILGPMAVFTLMMVIFSAAMFYNLVRTRRFEFDREKKLGRTWRLLKEGDGEVKPKKGRSTVGV